MTESLQVWRTSAAIENAQTLVPVHLLRSRLKFSARHYAAIHTSWRGVNVTLSLRGHVPEWTIAGTPLFGVLADPSKPQGWNTILERIVLPEAVRVEAVYRLRRTYSDGSYVLEGVCARGIPLVVHRIEDPEAREAALAAFEDARL